MKFNFSISVLFCLVIALSAGAQSKKIMTFAGAGGTGTFSGDGWAATGAYFNGPNSVAADRFGNVYIVDYFNIRVRVVRANGVINTYAGNGGIGSYTNNTLASSTHIHPACVVADGKRNIYISDDNVHVIYKVDKNGIITKVVGTSNTPGFGGDGGPASAARLNTPRGLAVDKYNNLYIAEVANHIIRKVDTFGVVTTVAGDTNRIAGYSGDGGAATAARLDSPCAIAVNRYGQLFICDYHNNVVRKVDTNGKISTFAGIGAVGYTGDMANAIGARFRYPSGIAVDTNRFVYISDAGNHAIRYVDTLGIIRTLAGNGTAGFGGDLGAPEGANLFNPQGLTIDSLGTLYIADANNQRIRMIFKATLAVSSVNSIQLSIAPNPASHQVTISGLDNNSANVSVYDVAGREVYSSEVTGRQAASINVSMFAPGLHVIRVYDAHGNVQATGQFVKE